VAIARAIINEPKIILADEPTGNLDTKNSEMCAIYAASAEQGAGPNHRHDTHNPEAAAYSDRVVHMRDRASSSTECQPTDMRTLWRGIVRVVFLVSRRAGRGSTTLLSPDHPFWSFSHRSSYISTISLLSGRHPRKL